jgi:chromosome segregation ATPase
LLDVDKQKTDLTSTVERLKAERDALSRSTSDAKILARQAEEAERRLNAASNALANVDARRKQLETDASAAQTRFEQIQKEADDLRQARQKLTTDLAALRQQIQTQNDQLATFDQKAAELKALQTAIQQEEQKLAKSQQQFAIVEVRAGEMETRHTKAASEFAQLTNRLAQARKDNADAEARLDSSKGALQRADDELAAARAQLQVFVVKQGELTREASRLDATIERLKKEKEALEKEIGRQEAQRQKNPSEDQK